jgi:DNA-binding protein HU-beta
MASKKKSTPAKKAAPAKKKAPAKKATSAKKTTAKKSVPKEDIKALTGVVAPPVTMSQPEPVKPLKKSLFRRLFPKK